MKSINYNTLMVLQLLGSACILAFVPNNLAKAGCFLIWWLLTFRKLTKGELVTFLGAACFFTYMDYETLKKGLFQFNHPDFLMMPYYEPLLWGYLLLNTMHFVGGTPPKTNWKAGLALLIILSMPYLVIFDQQMLSYITTAIVVGALLIFREKLDLAYAGYMVFIGFIWEYTGVMSGQWSYPNPPAGGVPPWFIPTFAGVGVILRRMVVPLLHQEKSN